VANFTIASTPRTFDRASGEWKDGDALFLRASVWREFAEHVAGSLTKGMRVIAQGNLRQRNYETREGERRSSIELDVQEIGPSLRYATAQVTRSAAPAGGFGGGRSGGAPQQIPGGAPQAAPQSGGEPWATPGSTGADAWSTPGSFSDDDTPF
jgi:single-strand DNA-binding protein